MPDFPQWSLARLCDFIEKAEGGDWTQSEASGMLFSRICRQSPDVAGWIKAETGISFTLPDDKATGDQAATLASMAKPPMAQEQITVLAKAMFRLLETGKPCDDRIASADFARIEQLSATFLAVQEHLPVWEEFANKGKNRQYLNISDKSMTDRLVQMERATAAGGYEMSVTKKAKGALNALTGMLAKKTGGRTDEQKKWTLNVIPALERLSIALKNADAQLKGIVAHKMNHDVPLPEAPEATIKELSKALRCIDFTELFLSLAEIDTGKWTKETEALHKGLSSHYDELEKTCRSALEDMKAERFVYEKDTQPNQSKLQEAQKALDHLVDEANIPQTRDIAAALEEICGKARELLPRSLEHEREPMKKIAERLVELTNSLKQGDILLSQAGGVLEGLSSMSEGVRTTSIPLQQDKAIMAKMLEDNLSALTKAQEKLKGKAKSLRESMEVSLEHKSFGHELYLQMETDIRQQIILLKNTKALLVGNPSVFEPLEKWVGKHLGSADDKITAMLSAMGFRGKQVLRATASGLVHGGNKVLRKITPASPDKKAHQERVREAVRAVRADMELVKRQAAKLVMATGEVLDPGKPKPRQHDDRLLDLSLKNEQLTKTKAGLRDEKLADLQAQRKELDKALSKLEKTQKDVGEKLLAEALLLTGPANSKKSKELNSLNQQLADVAKACKQAHRKISDSVSRLATPPGTAGSAVPAAFNNRFKALHSNIQAVKDTHSHINKAWGKIQGSVPSQEREAANNALAEINRLILSASDKLKAVDRQKLKADLSGLRTALASLGGVVPQRLPLEKMQQALADVDRGMAEWAKAENPPLGAVVAGMPKVQAALAGLLGSWNELSEAAQEAVLQKAGGGRDVTKALRDDFKKASDLLAAADENLPKLVILLSQAQRKLVDLKDGVVGTKLSEKDAERMKGSLAKITSELDTVLHDAKSAEKPQQKLRPELLGNKTDRKHEVNVVQQALNTIRDEMGKTELLAAKLTERRLDLFSHQSHVIKDIATKFAELRAQVKEASPEMIAQFDADIERHITWLSGRFGKTGDEGGSYFAERLKNEYLLACANEMLEAQSLEDALSADPNFVDRALKKAGGSVTGQVASRTAKVLLGGSVVSQFYSFPISVVKSLYKGVTTGMEHHEYGKQVRATLKPGEILPDNVTKAIRTAFWRNTLLAAAKPLLPSEAKLAIDVGLAAVKGARDGWGTVVKSPVEEVISAVAFQSVGYAGREMYRDILNARADSKVAEIKAALHDCDPSSSVGFERVQDKYDSEPELFLRALVEYYKEVAEVGPDSSALSPVDDLKFRADQEEGRILPKGVTIQARQREILKAAQIIRDADHKLLTSVKLTVDEQATLKDVKRRMSDRVEQLKDLPPEENSSPQAKRKIVKRENIDQKSPEQIIASINSQYNLQLLPNTEVEVYQTSPMYGAKKISLKAALENQNGNVLHIKYPKECNDAAKAGLESYRERNSRPEKMRLMAKQMTARQWVEYLEFKHDVSLSNVNTKLQSVNNPSHYYDFPLDAALDFRYQNGARIPDFSSDDIKISGKPTPAGLVDDLNIYMGRRDHVPESDEEKQRVAVIYYQRMVSAHESSRGSVSALDDLIRSGELPDSCRPLWNALSLASEPENAIDSASSQIENINDERSRLGNLEQWVKDYMEPKIREAGYTGTIDWNAKVTVWKKGVEPSSQAGWIADDGAHAPTKKGEYTLLQYATREWARDIGSDDWDEYYAESDNTDDKIIVDVLNRENPQAAYFEEIKSFYDRPDVKSELLSSYRRNLLSAVEEYARDHDDIGDEVFQKIKNGEVDLVELDGKRLNNLVRIPLSNGNALFVSLTDNAVYEASVVDEGRSFKFANKELAQEFSNTLRGCSTLRTAMDPKTNFGTVKDDGTLELFDERKAKNVFGGNAIGASVDRGGQVVNRTGSLLKPAPLLASPNNLVGAQRGDYAAALYDVHKETAISDVDYQIYSTGEMRLNYWMNNINKWGTRAGIIYFPVLAVGGAPISATASWLLTLSTGTTTELAMAFGADRNDAADEHLKNAWISVVAEGLGQKLGEAMPAVAKKIKNLIKDAPKGASFKEWAIWAKGKVKQGFGIKNKGGGLSQSTLDDSISGSNARDVPGSSSNGARPGSVSRPDYSYGSQLRSPPLNKAAIRNAVGNVDDSVTAYSRTFSTSRNFDSVPGELKNRAVFYKLRKEGYQVQMGFVTVTNETGAKSRALVMKASKFGQEDAYIHIQSGSPGADSIKIYNKQEFNAKYVSDKNFANDLVTVDWQNGFYAAQKSGYFGDNHKFGDDASAINTPAWYKSQRIETAIELRRTRVKEIASGESPSRNGVTSTESDAATDANKVSVSEGGAQAKPKTVEQLRDRLIKLLGIKPQPAFDPDTTLGAPGGYIAVEYTPTLVSIVESIFGKNESVASEVNGPEANSAGAQPAAGHENERYIGTDITLMSTRRGSDGKVMVKVISSNGESVPSFRKNDEREAVNQARQVHRNLNFKSPERSSALTVQALSFRNTIGHNVDPDAVKTPVVVVIDASKIPGYQSGNPLPEEIPVEAIVEIKTDQGDVEAIDVFADTIMGRDVSVSEFEVMKNGQNYSSKEGQTYHDVKEMFKRQFPKYEPRQLSTFDTVNRQKIFLETGVDDENKPLPVGTVFNLPWVNPMEAGGSYFSEEGQSYYDVLDLFQRAFPHHRPGDFREFYNLNNQNIPKDVVNPNKQKLQAGTEFHIPNVRALPREEDAR
ncbi:hypothetical protein CXB49_07510 [Chromobacterium sp. ATCC 53434]|nr:hypothetical protein CXB49_07510 [Chromobacterium sp. ATCC 53434]